MTLWTGMDGEAWWMHEKCLNGLYSILKKKKINSFIFLFDADGSKSVLLLVTMWLYLYIHIITEFYTEFLRFTISYVY